MATVTEPVSEQALADQLVTLQDVDWKGYVALLRIRGERSRPRMIDLDRTVSLMSPSYLHETLAGRLGILVREITVELKIPCTPAGSTTFHRRSKRGGVEADESLYLANAHRVRGKKTLDMRIDPPPDLTIEAVDSRSAQAALEVYRPPRVPEVWIADQTRLAIQILDANNHYHHSAHSLVSPFLSAEEIHAWITRDQDESGTAWTRALRTWVQGTLKPRASTSANE